MIQADPCNVYGTRSPGAGTGVRDAVSARDESANAGVHVNLAAIDLVSIRLVVHCAKLGSLSAAARRGNMSVPTASHRLSNLEALFRTRFFERDYRGLQLTPAGAVFVSHADSVLQALHALGIQLGSMGRCPGGSLSGPARSDYGAMPAEVLQRSEYQLSRTA